MRNSLGLLLQRGLPLAATGAASQVLERLPAQFSIESGPQLTVAQVLVHMSSCARLR